MSLKQVQNKVALITGAKEGIGYQIALALAAKNFKIFLADKHDLSITKLHIVSATGNTDITAKYLDLASLASIKSFAKDFVANQPCLHVLVNNAGIFVSKISRTEDDLDYVMQVNHFGPMLLTELLIDKLKSSQPSRIIFISSMGSFFHNLTVENLNKPQMVPFLSSTLTYYNSKLCNMIVSKYFAKNLSQFGVTSNCVHPGMTNTSFLLREFDMLKYVSPVAAAVLRLMTQDVTKAAQLPVYLASEKSLEEVTGKYYVNYLIHDQPKVLEDDTFCDMIWCQSRLLLGLK